MDTVPTFEEYEASITPDIWCYPLLDLKYKRHDYTWHEVSERIFYGQLECVPPKRMKQNAFMVGECWDYNYEQRDEIYAAFVEVDNRYFGRYSILRNFDPEVFTKEIKAQFNL